MSIITTTTTDRSSDQSVCPVCDRRHQYPPLGRQGCVARARRLLAAVAEADQLALVGDVSTMSRLAAASLVRCSGHQTVVMAVLAGTTRTAWGDAVAERLAEEGPEWHDVVVAALQRGSVAVASRVGPAETGAYRTAQRELARLALVVPTAPLEQLVRRQVLSATARQRALARLAREAPIRAGRYVADLTPRQVSRVLATGDPEVCVRAAVSRPDLSLIQREMVRDALAAQPMGAWASQMFAAAIERRIAGPTVFESRYRRVASLEWGDVCVIEGTPVVHGKVSGWQYYSAREGSHYRQAAYVGGWDDAGWWVVRVASSASDVRDALGSLESIEIRRARAAGRRVVRQGGIYGIETSTSRDAPSGALLGTSHVWDQRTRVLSHPRHRSMRIPFPVRFTRQRLLATKRR